MFYVIESKTEVVMEKPSNKKLENKMADSCFCFVKPIK